MLELLQQLKKLKEDRPEKCLLHGEIVTLYCEDCNELICLECQLDTHSNHNCHNIADIYPEKQKIIETHITILKEKTNQFQQVIETFTNKEMEIEINEREIKRKINLEAQVAINKIIECQNDLLEQACTVAKGKITSLSMQRNRAEEIVMQFKGCDELITSNLKEWGIGKIVRDTPSIVKGIDTVCNLFTDVVVFQPIEDADLVFQPTNELLFGKLEYSLCCDQTVIINPAFVEEETIIALFLKNDKNEPHPVHQSAIKAKITSHKKMQAINCDAIQISQGVYKMVFTSSVRGEHMLNIFVGGVEIKDSPFKIQVLPKTNSIGHKQLNMTYGLKSPWGIGVCNDAQGLIVVAENGNNCLTLLGEDGQHKGQLTMDDKSLNHPRGVAVTPDSNIIVTDDHRVTMLTLEGILLAQFGDKQPGHSTTSLNYPVGIAIHHTTGDVYVADSKNDRIVVLDPNLSFRYEFSNTIREPSDVAFDNNGYLYVTQYKIDHVTKYSSNGVPCGIIGSRGKKPGYLMHPVSLAIRNNEVYVCENGNDRISIFTLDGEFLHLFLERDSLLTSIAVSHNEYIYISDCNNGRVIIY